MKKLFLATIIMIAIFSLGFSNTSVTESFITSINKQSVSVSLQSFATSKLTVKILDFNGNEILTKKSNKNLANYILQLNNLEDGNYLVEISDKLKTKSQYFMINDGIVYIDQNAKATFKPSIEIKGKKAYVNLLALESDVNVSFSDKEGNIVYSDKISNVSNMHKVYDFMHLPTGTYFMNVKVGDKTYSEIVYR
jgi:hypothetical protein